LLLALIEHTIGGTMIGGHVRKQVFVGSVACLALLGVTLSYQGPTRASEFIILGTASGPNSEATRAQPANALMVGGQLYLIDAGDGAVAQLAKANLRLPAVRAVFLSHLHFDHTAGMLAVVGLRMQLETRGTLRVYGPPGTRTFIDGLLAASAPAMRAGYGIPGQGWSADIQVTELKDGAVLAIDGFKLTVAENSHFSMPEGNTDEPKESPCRIGSISRIAPSFTAAIPAPAKPLLRSRMAPTCSLPR